MNLNEMEREGLLDEIAGLIQDDTSAGIVLRRVGYPRAERPTMSRYNNNPLEFWASVCEEVEKGITKNTDLMQIIDAVAERYPGNQTLRRYLLQENESNKEVEHNDSNNNNTKQIFNISIEGWNNVDSLINESQRIASELNMSSNTVTLAFANIEGIILALDGWTAKQTNELAIRLRRIGGEADRHIDTNIATSDFKDYLIKRLFVEGPDQSRFEINDIRGSTKVGEVADGIISTEYDPKVFGRDSKGKGREVVIDKQSKDGKSERLQPDKTLHDLNIVEDDVLHISPEATAGQINPIIREAALVKAKAQILEYAKANPGFEVSANMNYAPTEYVFKFKTPSFAIPSSNEELPQVIENHELYVVLNANYPIVIPEAFWQTPIFHPNIEPETGFVCPGDLEQRYFPGLEFNELIRFYIDYAGYRIYNVNEVFNEKAQKWALTKDGVEAIIGIGGKEFKLRKEEDSEFKPRKLDIRRL